MKLAPSNLFVVVFPLLVTQAPTTTTLAAPPMRGSIVSWGAPLAGIDYSHQYMAVAANGSQNIGLRADGSISAWGCGYPYVPRDCDLPSPNEDFIAIAAGYAHGVGLKKDGTVIAWGDDYYGQTDILEEPLESTAISAGAQQSFAVRSDGSIVAWGCRNVYCSEWQGGWDCWCLSPASAPNSNATFVSVAAGEEHAVGLHADGSITAWGSNTYSQLNVSLPNAGFAKIAAGFVHSIALKFDGSVIAWGCGGPYDYGQCTVPEPNSDFVEIAAGNFLSLGLRSDGSIVRWGGCGSQCEVPSPNSGFIAIAAGRYNSVGIRLRPGDFNGDGVVDLTDSEDFIAIMAGPDLQASIDRWRFLDVDDDYDVDLADFAIAQNHFTGHDLCFGGTCQECLNDADCDDADSNTLDVCEDDNTCSHTPVP